MLELETQSEQPLDASVPPKGRPGRRETPALRRQLEAKNAELESYDYTLSHDLKNPLVTIKGFLGMVEKDARAAGISQER